MFAALIAEASHGGIATVLHTFTTTGDKILDRPLQEAGGKGLFTKELDRAQELGEIDIAVHSLKDVTVTLPEHLYLATFLEREDPRDCLIGPVGSLADLPHGAVVGSSSLRRQAQLLAARPERAHPEPEASEQPDSASSREPQAAAPGRHAPTAFITFSKRNNASATSSPTWPACGKVWTNSPRPSTRAALAHASKWTRLGRPC
jgi:hypothetical protein